MEITLEMVERLKEKANISYAQAKEEGAYFTTKGETPPPPPPAEPLPARLPGKKQKTPKQPKSGKGGVRRFFITLRRWLVDNELEIWRRDQPVTALPVLILVLLLCCAFWVTALILVLGLFLGFRYRFSGPDLERDDINSVMGSVADTASDLGRQVMDELKHDWHSDEQHSEDEKK